MLKMNDTYCYRTFLKKKYGNKNAPRCLEPMSENFTSKNMYLFLEDDRVVLGGVNDLLKGYITESAQ